MNYRHISFDLDGTLIDSIDVMRAAWEETVDKFHLVHDFSEYKQEIGLPFHVIMNSIGVVDDDREIEKYYFSRTEKYADQVKIYSGALEFIERIKRSNMTTSIITSKPKKNTKDILKHFNISVDVLVCGDDPSGSKPSAEPMQYVRKVLGLDKDDSVLYFGDMITDIVFCINSNIDYCHCDFGIYGILPKYLVPAPISIQDWHDIKLDSLL